ncbi:MAG TPA: von Willebrand factor type A domain-containing protein [Verrucomicrobiae bacterium]|nr:von Willebrand factor type A domain-containing protein [Verrucomicrobiae bacterium]
MKIDPNDPRLTAYVLGELDDAERTKIEALLQDDETARREIETIRTARATITNELRSEPCPRLAPEQIAAIHERAASRKPARAPFPWWRLLGWATALGAATALTLLQFRPLDQHREKARRLPVYTASPNSSTVAGATAETGHLRLEAPPAPKDVSGSLTLSLNRPEPNPPAIAGQPGRSSTTPQSQHGPSMVTPGSDASGKTVVRANQEITSRLVEIAPASPAQSSSGATLTYNDGHAAWQAGAVSAYRAIGRAESSIGQPNDRITISRGAESRTLPLDDVQSLNYAQSGNESPHSYYDRGQIEWDQYFPPQTESVSPSSPSAESYSHSIENPFVTVAQNPLSTFGLDADTASYANIRRFLNQGTLPPHDAVRIEEMLNYFSYDYPRPHGREPFALYAEMSECPWNPAHRLALIGLKATDIASHKIQPMNLVFLIDVSGSMGDQNELPLVKQALRLLVDQLTPRDRVAIVVYAGDSRVALRSTPGDDKTAILEVIDSLEAGGSTNGGAGIQSAYREALANFIEGGVNRVILCTDGDFNVGVTDPNQLVQMVQQQAQSHVFLTILGVGMGNLKDSTMQKLADKGSGNYAYIDNLDEAHKVLVEQMRGTLVTVARDAKVQIEFNPTLVRSYRLIGYEKRRLRARDFNNDRKVAGDIGAGHTVTALYEIVPATAPAEPGVDPLKYQSSPRSAASAELMTVKLRYKDPEASTSQLLTAAVRDSGASWRGTSSDFRFAASVAAFGMILRDSPYKGASTFNLVHELADGARGRDENGYRSEFISLVDQARTLSGNVVPDDP